MTVKVERNERDREGATDPSLEVVAAEAMRFVNEEAGFAQVYTISRAGYPVGRTMVAMLQPDWSVYLVQRKVHRRNDQLRRDPRAEVLWSGSPAADSVNDRPHVFDWGLTIPRAVFVRGDASFMDDDKLLEVFFAQTAAQRSKGLTKAPLRTPENVLEELIGVDIRARQVRAEGFGIGAISYTWEVG